MPDDISIKDASEVARPVATDEVGGRNFQWVKLAFGADGAVTVVESATGLPVAIVGTPNVNATIAGNVEVVNDVGNPLPVSGTVTANAGSNLNTSLLALEAGGNLATIAGAVRAEDTVHASGDVGIMALAVRNDADVTLAADGDYHPLVMNLAGRLKVAALPGDIPATTGNITGNGQTVQCDVLRASNVMARCTGTFSAVNCTFEGSIDNAASWFGIQACRTNANTVELTTGSLSAAPAYAWELSVNGLTHVRVRSTAYTSGTQVWRFQPAPYATEPIPALQPITFASAQAVTQSGTWTVQPGNTANTTAWLASLRGTASVTGAYTKHRLLAAATTNATSVKASAGMVYEAKLFNNSATKLFFKFYNKASAPTVGTDTPTETFVLQPNSALILDWANGNPFPTGIAYAITGGVTDADATAVGAANDATVHLYYL
jgi:hypothetical protein